MPSDPNHLLSKIDALRALVVAQAVELATQRTELTAVGAGLIEQRYEIETLRSRLARLLRTTFGRSLDKLQGELEQLEFPLTDLDEQLAETEDAGETAEIPAVGAAKPVRRPLPAALPRDVVEHAAPCGAGGACLACGGVLRPLGEDVTELLDYVPGSFRVICHMRPKLSCRRCDAIVRAPAPSLPIRRGWAGAGLLAHVLVAKYADHLPLHRQAEIFARADVELGRSTLADMVG